MRKHNRRRYLFCSALSVVLLFQILTYPASASDGGAADKLLALTFDDGPTGKYTAALLDGLAARQIQCTFFVCGYRIDQYPQLLERIAAEGHEIGLHGQTHCYFRDLSTEQIRQELVPMSDAIEVCTGVRPSLLRPPGGLYSDTLLAEAQQENLSLILWSVDPRDWESHSSEVVQSRILHDAKPGSIILMHDSSTSSVSAALSIIDQLRAQGYRFVTVSELAASTGIPLIPGKSYFSFPNS